MTSLKKCLLVSWMNVLFVWPSHLHFCPVTISLFKMCQLPSHNAAGRCFAYRSTDQAALLDVLGVTGGGVGRLTYPHIWLVAPTQSLLQKVKDSSSSNPRRHLQPIYCSSAVKFTNLEIKKNSWLYHPICSGKGIGVKGSPKQTSGVRPHSTGSWLAPTSSQKRDRGQTSGVSETIQRGHCSKNSIYANLKSLT